MMKRGVVRAVLAALALGGSADADMMPVSQRETGYRPLSCAYTPACLPSAEGCGSRASWPQLSAAGLPSLGFLLEAPTDAEATGERPCPCGF